LNVGRYKYKTNLRIDEKVLVAAVMVSESWKKNCSSIFKNFGLTYPQYNVLRALQASEDGINTITNISVAMLVSGANMTGIAKRMEKNGFLIRRGDPDDERRTMLQITPRGINTMKHIAGDLDRLIDHLLQDIPVPQRAELLDAFKKILKVSKTFNPDK
jgi:DNA-binding MarR family transcriptional regulator